MSRLSIWFFTISMLWGAACQVQADPALLQQRDAQDFINTLVKKDHFDRSQLTKVLREARFQPQIIESMERPYEKKPWDVYKKIFLTPERVQAGIAFWQANREALKKAELQYGVPANIIVAIIGVETLYGKHQGNYRVLDALSTLAFYYPKRAPYFTRELREFLLLCREQNVSPLQYLGSYAGAMGKPQFMPSSYRFYAVDFTGNGKIDLMNEDRDVIGSVANFFHKHGWKSHASIAQPAKVTGSAYKALVTNTKTPDYPIKTLAAAGIKGQILPVDRPEKAGLLALDYTSSDSASSDSEYWLAYPNFYVITRYNSSPQYALVVYLLSQQLHQQWAARQERVHAYV